MLDKDQIFLLLVDFQEKLFNAMWEKESLVRNLEILVRGAGVFKMPLVMTEQYPEGLGETIPEIARVIREERPQLRPIRKMTFSCWGEPACREAIKDLGRKTVLLAGIEAHICVYQSALDLREAGYHVHVITDAVSSRTPQNKTVGLGLMERAGAALTSVETALFELMRTAEAPDFRKLSRIVK